MRPPRGSQRRRLILALFALWIAATGGLFLVAVATATPWDSTPNCEWPDKYANFCSNPRLMNAAVVVGSVGFFLLYLGTVWTIRGDESRLVRWVRALMRLLRRRRGPR